MGQMGELRTVGPNHAVHGVLTLLTFWACGGWAWIWLVVALQNRQHTIDEHGRRPPASYDRVGALFVQDDGVVRWVNVASAAAMIGAVVLLLAVVNLT
jgi:hypothetical protein